jgi:hypothetical protein
LIEVKELAERAVDLDADEKCVRWLVAKKGFLSMGG